MSNRSRDGRGLYSDRSVESLEVIAAGAQNDQRARAESFTRRRSFRCQLTLLSRPLHHVTCSKRGAAIWTEPTERARRLRHRNSLRRPRNATSSFRLLTFLHLSPTTMTRRAIRNLECPSLSRPR